MTEDKVKLELLPCPFCRAELRQVPGDEVLAHPPTPPGEEPCAASSFGVWMKDAKRIAAWNRRSPLPAGGKVEGWLERLADILDEDAPNKWVWKNHASEDEWLTEKILPLLRELRAYLTAAARRSPLPAGGEVDEKALEAANRIETKRRVTEPLPYSIEDAQRVASELIRLSDLTAAAGTQTAGVRVKALEWIDAKEPTAKTPFGLYRIILYGRFWAVYFNDDLCTEQPASEGEAKAAAQADYEQRILSALDIPTTAGEGER